MFHESLKPNCMKIKCRLTQNSNWARNLWYFLHDPFSSQAFFVALSVNRFVANPTKASPNVNLARGRNKNKFSRRYKDFHENSLISPKASCPCDVSLRFVLGVMHMERLVTQFVKCANAACVFLVTHGMNRPLLNVKKWELERGSPLRLSFSL